MKTNLSVFFFFGNNVGSSSCCCYLVQVVDLQKATYGHYYDEDPCVEELELVHPGKRQLYGDGHGFHTHNLTRETETLT